MNVKNHAIAIVAHLADEEFAKNVIDRNDGSKPIVIIGTPLDAIYAISNLPTPPHHILIDIGERGEDILAEIDSIAEYCEPSTRVVVIGSINDVNFYRQLKMRGIAEYFTRSARADDVSAILFYKPIVKSGKKGDVISFMSASSGDGASTIALNTAFVLATEYNKSVLLVDMDYQFGMVAKSLDLSTPFGIKELFDNPERGIDSTLVERMIICYKSTNLKIIAAPNQLHYIPEVNNQLIHNLIDTLVNDYDIVIIDLPHIWTPLISSILVQSKHCVMVAQLWLKSITHASRLLSNWRSAGVKNSQITLVSNRRGAKFKEAVSPSDFERVCSLPFSCDFENDTKSVIEAKNNGRTIVEGDASDLNRQLKKFASQFVVGTGSKLANNNMDIANNRKSILGSLFKK
ncbi:MAG: AAA family ATPase, partial [Pseudomonadota bacterium]